MTTHNRPHDQSESLDSSTPVSVVIPTYFRYDHLEKLLNDLALQTHMPDEVLVIDQSASDACPDGFYQQFPALPITVLHYPHPSLTVTRNIGAACSQNEILLFLDDDLIIPADLIENHLKVMNRERVDVTSGAVSRTGDLSDNYPWDRASMDPVRAFTSSPNYKFNGMTIGISAGNFLVKKAKLKKVGGFDPFIPRFVDHELGIRLFFSGAKIFHSYEPAARHLRAEDGGTRKSLSNNAQEVSAIYLHLKHFPGWSTKQFVLLKLLSAVLGKNSRRRPWKSITQPIRLFRSYREAKRLLNDAKSSGSASSNGWHGVKSDERSSYSNNWTN